MTRRRSTLVAVALAMVATTALALTTVTGAAAAESGGKAKAPAWSVGDCYTRGDVDLDVVDLTSKVPCSKEHGLQVVGGAALPAALAAAGLDALTDRTSAVRPQLLTFVRETCAPEEVVTNIYPKATAKRLAALFTQRDVTDWMPPAAGQMGWVMPDPESFAAGATDLLCVHIANKAIHGTSAGDLRGISTNATLPDQRLCGRFRADGLGSDGVQCDRVHDIESLLWVGLDVTGKPADPQTWTADDWTDLDDACEQFATAVIGARRTDIVVNADTDPTQDPIDGTRFFNCRAFPKVETKAFPANVILTALGRTKIPFTNP